VKPNSIAATVSTPRLLAAGGSAVLGGLLLVLLWTPAAHASGATIPVIGESDAGPSVRIGFAIAIGVELVLSLVFQFGAKIDVSKVFVGTDNRISTSKTIAAVWTFVVGAAVFAIVYAKLRGHGAPLEATEAGGRVGQYALLFGGPIGAAILSKAIVGGQVASQSNAKTTGSPQLGDLVSNDQGEADLGDLQYVIFNTVALAFVLLTMLVHEPSAGLPHIPDVLLGLTSVSAAGYVGKKMLPPQAITAELVVTKGKAEPPAAVGIAMTGLPQPAGAQGSFWVRFGAADKGALYPAPVSPAGAANVPAVVKGAPGDVEVLVTTEGGAEVKAGTFTIE
jgi:hypothetical protein